MLTARRAEIERVHSEGVYEIFLIRDCKDAPKKLLVLIWVDTDKSGSRAQENSIETVCQGIQNEEAMQDSKSSTRFSVVLCNATSLSCEGACVNHDVGEFVKQLEAIEVEKPRHRQSTFRRNSPETHLHPTSRRGSSEVWRRQSWQIDQEHARNSRCFPHLVT